MSKKYIFLDIDGTLMDCSNGEFIPESTLQAIAAARQKGNRVFICTGRTPAELTPKLRAIELDGIVCAAGAEVLVGDKVIFRHTIAPTEIERLLAVAAQNSFGIVLQGREKSYLDERGDYFSRQIGWQPSEDSEFGKMAQLVFTALADYHKQPAEISKVLFLTDDKQQLKDAYQKLRPDYQMALHGEDSTVCVGELCSNGIIKSTGIQRVLEYFGELDAVTYAYGDSGNDIDMLVYCTHGVAMGNATAEAKAVADEVCETLFDEGIYKSFKRNGLI